MVDDDVAGGVPATASMVLPEAPSIVAPTTLPAAVAAMEQLRQHEEKMLVRLRLDLRHIVDELLKVCKRGLVVVVEHGLADARLFEGRFALRGDLFLCLGGGRRVNTVHAV